MCACLKGNNGWSIFNVSGKPLLSCGCLFSVLKESGFKTARLHNGKGRTTHQILKNTFLILSFL